nr:MAG TPA: Protein of unknown function (DUF1242) [Caudoviricetes sp.]
MHINFYFIVFLFICTCFYMRLVVLSQVYD